MKRTLGILFFFVLFNCGSSLLYAQTTGSISGYVKDSTGAVVPGAQVTVTNSATGFSRKVTTTDEGYYSVPSLPVGNYSVTASLQGFKTIVQRDVGVDVAKSSIVDIALEVGQVTESVEVSRTSEKVETESATLGETVDERRIVGLPLNGRNFLQLAILQPGAVPGLQLSHNNTATTPGGAANSPQVNGLRGQSNNYLLDGANNNEAFLGEAGALPPPEAIAEFRMLSNSYSAEYGRGGGSIISVVTRSGTNQLHGSVYEFFRNDVLDARNFFAAEKSPLRRNQFGFTLGGPIRENRTFIFGAYEGFREARSVSLASLVPSLAQRAGNFSALNPAPVNCTDPGAICDPTTGRPFPGNIIPQDRFGPIARNILNHYPLPNDPSGQPIHNFQSPEPTTSDQFTIRFDHQISQKQNVTARYVFVDGDSETTRVSGNFGSILALPEFKSLDTFRFQNIVLADNYIFSPKLLNTARLSYHRYAGQGFAAKEPVVGLREFGFTNPIAVDESLAYPQIVVAGLSGLGYSTSGPTVRAENTFQFDDDVVYSGDKHTFRFGLELNRIRHTILSPQGFGIIVGYLGSRTGNPVADMLIDFAGSVSQGAGSADRDWRSFWTQAYFQDDLRITPRLTLNLGIRYELKTPYKELRNRRASFQPGVRSSVFPDAGLGQVFVGDPNVTDTTVELQKGNFAPRIGFAWDIFGKAKTSLRGGWGIFYDTSTFFIVHQSVVAPPYSSIYSTAPPPSRLADPFSNNPIVTPGSTLAPFVKPYQLTFLDPNWRNPYVHQWNLTLEHEFPGTFVVQTAYVGTAGRNLPGAKNINVPAFIPGNTTAANAQARRPFQDFNVLLQLSSEFRSIYNGFQLSVRRPFRRAFNLGVAYTYSKTLDDSSVPGPFRAALNQTVSLIPTYNDVRLERVELYSMCDSASWSTEFGNCHFIRIRRGLLESFWVDGR